MDAPSANFLDRTLALLRARRGEWPAICRATRLDYSWLSKLAQGQIHDPGIRRLQVLHDYLVAQPSDARDAAA
jgi:predicted metal-dependent HD superfamily phosphohydrolase